MRQILLLILILTQNVTFGQMKALEGVWYAKHIAYQFPHDGSAKIFTKRSIPNCTQRLVIDSLGNYSLLLRGTTEVDTVYGNVSILGDTLIFESSHKGRETTHEHYIVYTLTHDQLIYSNKRISTQDTGQLNIEPFSPVETPSRFKFGQDSLLTLIYQEIGSVDPDSAYLNIYKFVVDEAGIAKPETINRVKGNQDYTSQLKTIVETHCKEFIPATQNSKAVGSYQTIIFTL